MLIQIFACVKHQLQYLLFEETVNALVYLCFYQFIITATAQSDFTRYGGNIPAEISPETREMAHCNRTAAVERLVHARYR